MGDRSLFQSALSPISSSLVSFWVPSPLRPARVPWMIAHALLALGLVAAMASGQSTLPLQPAAPSAPGPGSAPVGAAADDAWLADTGKLYYSTTRAGLSGFDCTVHPDWRALFMTASPGADVREDDEHLVLLKRVKILLHARMKATSAAGEPATGGPATGAAATDDSTVDWNPDPSPDQPLDNASNEMLARMHEATEQTLEGFLEFWTPFVDGSAIPDSAEGLTITHTGSGHTIHAAQGDMAITEIFSSDRLLEHFNVDMKSVSIHFQPAYEPTAQGLLVKSFQAHVQPAGAADQAAADQAAADQAAAGQAPVESQDMRVEIEYQTLDGFPIPARLNMEVAHSGTFTFLLDGCTVSLIGKPVPPPTVKPALQ